MGDLVTVSVVVAVVVLAVLAVAVMAAGGLRSDTRAEFGRPGLEGPLPARDLTGEGRMRDE